MIFSQKYCKFLPYKITLQPCIHDIYVGSNYVRSNQPCTLVSNLAGQTNQPEQSLITLVEKPLVTREIYSKYLNQVMSFIS